MIPPRGNFVSKKKKKEKRDIAVLKGMQCARLKGRRVRWIIRFQHLKGEAVWYIIGL